MGGIERLDELGEGLVLLGGLATLLDPALDRLEVGQGQLDLEDPQALERVVGTGHVGVDERPEQEHDRVDLADVGQELVAQAFAGAGPLDQAADVDELHARRHDLLGVGHRRQQVEPPVRDLGHPHVGVGGGEGVGRGERATAGERVVQRGLARVGEADEAESFHWRARYRSPLAAASQPQPGRLAGQSVAGNRGRAGRRGSRSRTPGDLPPSGSLSSSQPEERRRAPPTTRAARRRSPPARSARPRPPGRRRPPMQAPATAQSPRVAGHAATSAGPRPLSEERRSTRPMAAAVVVAESHRRAPLVADPGAVGIDDRVAADGERGEQRRRGASARWMPGPTSESSAAGHHGDREPRRRRLRSSPSRIDPAERRPPARRRRAPAGRPARSRRGGRPPTRPLMYTHVHETRRAPATAAPPGPARPWRPSSGGDQQRHRTGTAPTPSGRGRPAGAVLRIRFQVAWRHGRGRAQGRVARTTGSGARRGCARSRAPRRRRRCDAVTSSASREQHGVGVGDGHPEARPADQLEVVGHVAERHDLGGADAASSSSRSTVAALCTIGVGQLQERLVGGVGDQRPVAHHGLATAAAFPAGESCGKRTMSLVTGSSRNDRIGRDPHVLGQLPARTCAQSSRSMDVSAAELEPLLHAEDGLGERRQQVARPRPARHRRRGRCAPPVRGATGS